MEGRVRGVQVGGQGWPRSGRCAAAVQPWQRAPRALCDAPHVRLRLGLARPRRLAPSFSPRATAAAPYPCPSPPCLVSKTRSHEHLPRPAPRAAPRAARDTSMRPTALNCAAHRRAPLLHSHLHAAQPSPRRPYLFILIPRAAAPPACAVLKGAAAVAPLALGAVSHLPPHHAPHAAPQQPQLRFFASPPSAHSCRHRLLARHRAECCG